MIEYGGSHRAFIVEDPAKMDKKKKDCRSKGRPVREVMLRADGDGLPPTHGKLWKPSADLKMVRPLRTPPPGTNSCQPDFPRTLKSFQRALVARLDGAAPNTPADPNPGGIVGHPVGDGQAGRRGRVQRGGLRTPGPTIGGSTIPCRPTIYRNWGAYGQMVFFISRGS